MKTLEIVIQADTNDADYIMEVSEISQAVLDRFKPLIEAIKKNGGEFGWGEAKDVEYQNTYKQFDEELLDHFLEYVPYGEYGIHTIESIYVYPRPEKIKLL